MNDEPNENNTASATLLGLEEGQYVKFTYLAILLASALGFLSTVLSFVGVDLPGAGLMALIGLAGLIMAIVAWAGFKNQISAISLSHMKYIVILLIVVMVANWVLIATLGVNSMVFTVVNFVISLAYLALIYAGFRLSESGTMITQNAVKGEVLNLKNNLSQSISK